jgi:hypothetical protein
VAPPLPTVSVQGLGVVPADLLNTYVQTVVNFAALRNFTGLSNMVVSVQGGAAAGDGLGGFFYYNSSSVAADNGATVIVPTGNIQGAWLKLLSSYSYQVPLTGFSVQVPNGATSLLLNPAGTLAAGTIIFPTVPMDGQWLTIASSQTITALTLTAPAGQTILSPITTLAANSNAKWQYVASVATWFRI